MIRALWIYLKARFRMIGQCPPHHYEKDGQAFPFCVDCGDYRVHQQQRIINANAAYRRERKS